jgi:hypothetical protein
MHVSTVLKSERTIPAVPGMPRKYRFARRIHAICNLTALLF